MVLLGTEFEDYVIGLIKKQLSLEIDLNETENASLLAKWLPSINATSKNTIKTAKYLCKKLNFTEKEYRKILSKLRAKIDVVECD